MVKKIIFPIASLALVPATMITISCSQAATKSYSTKILNFGKDLNIIIQIEYQNDYLLDKASIEDFLVFNQEKELINIDYQNSSKKDNSIYLQLETNIVDSYFINIKNQDFYLEVSNSDLKIFDEYLINEDKKYFFELIKNMSKNKIPTIIDSRAASMPVQQSFYISLFNYYNNHNNLEKNHQDYVVQILTDEAWTQSRFHEEPLINNGIWNGISNLDEINQNNISFFNLISNKTTELNSTKGWIEKFNKVKEKFNLDQDTKFDYVIADLDFIRFINQFLQNPLSNELSILLKNVNRIIVISDGAAHTDQVVPFLFEKLVNHHPSPREEVISKLEAYQSNGVSSLNSKDILDLLLLKNYEVINPDSPFNFISFVNYDANIKNSLGINDLNMWNESTASTNFVEYANYIDDETNRKLFLETYSQLFLNTQDMNEIMINGYEEYDPNKRNAIFLGSSLFTPFNSNEMSPINFSRLQELPHLRSQVQATMDDLLKKFPLDEYNIIFKLHPIFSRANDVNNEIPINFIKLITNNKIQNPIIISPKIPLETLIANDYYLFESKSSLTQNNLTNFIFKSNEKYQPYEWTTFFGLQTTTTTIHTTRMFYQTTFNLTKNQIANLIPFTNFPIPRAFHVTKRKEDDDVKDYYEENLKTLKQIYYIYCPSLVYKDERLEKYDSISLNW